MLFRIKDKHLPKGWRRLEEGEIRQDGDKFYTNGAWNLSCMSGHEVTKHDLNVIRESWKAKTLSPKKHTFNQLSLVPSSILNGARKS